MGGGRTKRKSEGDLPPAKKQARWAEQEEDTENSSAEEESGDELFVAEKSAKVKQVKKTASKSRKSEPVKRLERSDDVERKDVELMGSQQFLNFVAKKEMDKSLAAKATAEFKARFTNNVEDDEKMLRKHVESLSKEATKRDTDFLEMFQEAFTTSRPKAPPAKDSTRGKSTPATMVFASLHQRSRQLISNASTIVKKFEEANNLTTSIELSDIIDVKSWDNSTTRTQEVIDLGHRAGLQRYDKMMAGDRSRLEFDDEQDCRVAEMYYPAERYPPTAGWSEIAKKAEKHTRHLLKALPVRVRVDRDSG